MYADWDSLELFAIVNLNGEIIMKGIRSIEKYIEAKQIFIVEITGRAFEEKGIDSNLASDDWNTAVINNFGDIIIPPDYSSICFEEETQTFIGNRSGGAKVRFDLNGFRVKY